MSRVRVGLIGFGAIGQQVATGIEAGRAGDAELVAILTRTPRIIELRALDRLGAGSSASRRPSPNRFRPRLTSRIAAPGRLATRVFH
jgi:pyrroline-5-carboxylate reductase